MPFTFAHPAAVIYLKRWPKWFDLSALIIGSMAPDFEYFIRFMAKSSVGHTFSGFLYFNLPLVFIIVYLWNYVIKNPLILSLPNPIQKYFMPFLSGKWGITSLKGVFVFIYSAIIGMITHVLWDSFTHVGGFFVSKIPLLSTVVDIFGMKIAIYKILQHESSLVGIAIIILYLYFLQKKDSVILPKVNKAKKLMYWASVLLLAIGITLFRAFFTLDIIKLNYYGIYIVTFISGVIIGLVLLSCIYKFLNIYERSV